MSDAIHDAKSILLKSADGIADLVDESVISFGLDMEVTAWNREAERIYGWNRDEVVGGVIQAAVKCSPSEPLTVILEKVHATGLWRGIHADDQDRRCCRRACQMGVAAQLGRDARRYR